MTETVAPPRVISAHTRLLLDAYARMTTAEKNPSGIWRRNEDGEVRRLRRLLDAQGCHWVPSIEVPATTTMGSRNSTQRSLVGLVRLPRLSGHPETLQ